MRRLYQKWGAAALILAGCAPPTRIPSLPPVVAGTLQRDEPFRLERVVAVVHPARPMIAYHLLWGDDAHGAWLPFTVPTDQEVVWVTYDSTGATDMLNLTWWRRVEGCRCDPHYARGVTAPGRSGLGS